MTESNKKRKIIENECLLYVDVLSHTMDAAREDNRSNDDCDKSIVSTHPMEEEKAPKGGKRRVLARGDCEVLIMGLKPQNI